MRRFWILTAFAAACGGDGGPAPTAPTVPVASITITSPAGNALAVGGSIQLAATARDAQNNPLPGRSITWSSGAEAVATVSAGGLVTGVGPGTAQIRAAAEGRLAEFAVTVVPQPWQLTGALTTGRTLLTLTLLADGTALAVGGQVLGGAAQTTRTSERYDPATGQWRSAGSLATGRADHVAIRLQNGKVLVAGGYSLELSARLASAELYDPVTDTWSPTGSMLTARDLPAAALLPDGRVLVVGGSGPGTNLDALSSAEVYDPASGTWSAVASLSVARAGHSATALANGTVLVAGGGSGTFTAPTLHASAEVFQPSTGSWTTTGSVGGARGYHRAVALADGRVLLAGGSDFVSTVFPAADLYDAAAGAWTATGALATGRVSHTATVLADGDVLVAGGSGNSGASFAGTERYGRAAGVWAAAGTLRVARANHAAVLLADGRVLVAGGQGAGAATSAELFDPR